MTKMTFNKSLAGVYYNETLVKGIYYNAILVYPFGMITFDTRIDCKIEPMATADGKMPYLPILENISYSEGETEIIELLFYGWFYEDEENGIIMQVTEETVFNKNTNVRAKWFPKYRNETEKFIEFDSVSEGLNTNDEFFYQNYSYFDRESGFRYFIISYDGVKMSAINVNSGFSYYLVCNCGETWRDFADSCRTVTGSGGHSQYITYHPIGVFPAGESPFGDVNRLVCFRINESDEIELFLMENDLYDEEVIATGWADPDDEIGWNVYDLQKNN